VTPLPRKFYLRSTVTVARELLGCVLRSTRRGVVTAGRIVETEAYLGPEDGASHAAIRPVASSARFYGNGGHAYVFRVYGLHLCLNAITGGLDEPGCVLIRAIEPTTGRVVMARRRGIEAASSRLGNGPGKLSQALGISLAHDGADLTRGSLVIEAPDVSRRFAIGVGPRIGISRARMEPLRFWIEGNPHVSVSRR
jgi:DNA-3-methyladenine glycosylase